jgi:hypothetical protein
MYEFSFQLEVNALCKEIPVIPVSKVVDEIRIRNLEKGRRRKRGTRGADPKQVEISYPGHHIKM